jgi:signal transduction histidine kinase
MKLPAKFSLKTIVTILSLVASVTLTLFVLFQNRVNQLKEFDLIHEKMEHLEITHSMQNEALLKSLSSFSSHYDYLVASSKDLFVAVENLAVTTTISIIHPMLMKQLKQQADDKRSLVERYKMGHAILRNSIYYLPSLLEGVWENRTPTQLQKKLSLLLTKVQAYYISPSHKGYQAAVLLQKKIEQLKVPASLMPFIEEAITHVQIILERKHDTYSLVQHYLDIPLQQTIAEIMDKTASLSVAVRREMLVIQWVLYYMMVLLALLVIYFLAALSRARTLAVEDAKLISQQQVELESKSKLASIGEMASHVAHEINNPLSVVYLTLRVLRTQLRKDEIDRKKSGEKVDEIEAMAKRMGKISSDLLAFSRDAARDPVELLSVGKLVNDTLSLCREKFVNQGIKLTVSEISEQLAIECRNVQLSQVLLNLLTNAHDAILDRSNPWIKLEVCDQGDSVLFAVVDCGEGIPPETAEKIFKPFFTTKRHGKGTGLGLSIISGIMESHNGKFELDQSSPNTRFTVTIPKAHVEKVEKK